MVYVGGFAPAKKGFYKKKPRREGSNIMVLVDESSKPLAILVTSASTHEVRLVKEVYKERVSLKKSRLTGDKAYDSDALDRTLACGGVEIKAPHRSGRRN